MDDQPGLLAAMWRYRYSSALVVALIVALTFFVTSMSSPNATATAVIGLRTPANDNVLAPGIEGDASLARYTAQRARFINSDAVVRDVAAQIGEDDLSTVRRNLQATPSATSNIVTVTVEADDTDAAVFFANAVVTAYQTQTRVQVQTLTEAAVAAIQQQIQTTIADATADDSRVLAGSVATTVSQLQERIGDLEASRAIFDDGVEFVTESNVQSATTRGIPVRELALGVILGFGVAVSLAWWRADRDRRVVSADRAAAILGGPLLAEPTTPANFDANDASDLAQLPSADYELMWAALWHHVERGAVIVQSVGEVRSADTVVNLAAAAAREDLKVLVVDAGFVGGVITGLFGLGEAKRGLREALRADGDWRELIFEVEVEGETASRYRFDLLPVGTTGTDYVPTSKAQESLDDWRKSYDLVIIDTDPIGRGPVFSKLAVACDGLIAVVSRGADEESVRAFRRQAELVDAQVIGFAFAEQGRPWQPMPANANRADRGRRAKRQRAADEQSA